MTRDVRPKTLADEFGLTEAEAADLRRQVEYGLISPPVRCEIVREKTE